MIDIFEKRKQDMIEELGRVVELESPSNDKSAVDELADYLAGRLRQAGAEVELSEQGRRGNHVIARWGDMDKDTILIIGHMDTVWPIGEVAERPFTVKEGKAYGPGVFDMKAGLVQVLFALEELDPAQSDNSVIVLFNSDEEIGSPTSRPIIEDLASECQAAFVLEPSVPPEGALKTFRKGVGMFEIEVTGKAAHAGADHQQGVSAIDEMSRLVLRLHDMTDYEAGITVNVGVVEGGTRSNVVAEKAVAEVDLRVSTMEQAEQMEERILSLEAEDDDAVLEITGGLNRPPMERTPLIVDLFEKAQAIGQEMGLDLKQAGTGGGSDGNFTAAKGVPTVDGLGAVGAGGHSVDEHIVLSELPKRTALLASLIKCLQI